MKTITEKITRAQRAWTQIITALAMLLMTAMSSAQSSNANLSNLVPSAGTLEPVFDPSTIAYAATVPFATTSMAVTPTQADVLATTTVNGVAVVSGVASGAITLSVGVNTITTVVTAEDLTTVKTYTLTVTRAAASTNANLSNLVSTAGTLTPTFDANTTSYNVVTLTTLASVTVTATKADVTAAITVNGIAVASGVASSAVALSMGPNTITIVVTAEDLTTTKTYTFTVTRFGIRYWDPASGGNFGTINNTTSWVPSLNIVWTNSNIGQTSRLSNFTTSLYDECNWGGPTGSLGGGTVPVGTVNARSLSFNTVAGSVTLSGGTITLAAATTLTALNTNTHTISSTLAGAATSLTKNGTGTIVISGNNTYTGPTNVAAGTLNIGSNALRNSPLNTSSSILGTASAGLKTTATSLTLGGLVGTQNLNALFTTTAGGYGSVASLILNPGTAVINNYSAVIADGALGMTLTKDGVGAQVLAGANTFTGATTLNGGKLTLDYSSQDNSKLADGAALVLSGGTLDLSGGTHLELVGSTTLTGAVALTRSSGAAIIALGDISGSGTIDFGASNIATTTDANDASGILGSYATVGGVSWAANDGSGNIVAYTGGTDIDARGPSSTIANGALTNVRIFGDGTSGNIELGATSTTINTLLQSNANFAPIVNSVGKTLGVSNISIASGAESLTIGVSAGDGMLQTAVSGGTLVLNNVNAVKTLTVNAAVVDNTTASGLSKVGAGSVVLAGANTYTGTTLVAAGTLSLTGSVSGSLMIVSGDAVLSQSATGSIAGAVDVTFASSGTSTLAGNNTYAGLTSITTGILNIQSATALGAIEGETTVASGTALQMQGAIVVGDEALTLNGNGVATTGALRSISGANTWGGLVTLGSSTRIHCDADTLTFDVALGDAISGSNSLVFGGNGNITVADPISTGANTITKEGTGTLILSAANTFTNSVNVGTGVLNIQNSTATGTIAGGVTVSGPAELQMQGDIAVGNEALFLQGTGISNTGALRNISGDNSWGGLISLAAATRFNSDAGTLTINVPSGSAIGGTGVAFANPPITFGGSGNITVADPISAGTGTLTKDGTGTLTLTAANVYSGVTTLSAGVLNATMSAALGNSSATNTLIFNGGTLQAGGAITSISTRPVTLTATGLIDTNSNIVSIAGVISGAAGMTKSGMGTLILSGANAYAGITTVSDGKLLINGNQPLATGDVSVIANATLGGTGTIGGNTVIADNGKLEFVISTTADSHDKLEVDAAKTFTFAGASSLTITVPPSGGAAPGIYTLLTAPGGIVGVVPATVNLPAGWTADPPMITGNELIINITFTGVPEIAVEEPDSTNIANNGSISFGSVTLGTNASMIITIRNVGTDILSLTGSPLVDVTGTNAADFTVTAVPATLVTSGGGSTTFTIRFSPGGSGVRNAELSIANNDSDENPFVINVSGTGQTKYDEWAGGALFDADTNGDGVKNGIAFLLGAASPSDDAIGLLPSVTSAGGALILTFDCLSSAGRGNAVFNVDHSSDLGNADAWTSALIPGAVGTTTVNGVSFAVTDPGAPGGPLHVVATVLSSEAALGKLFGLLNAVSPP